MIHLVTLNYAAIFLGGSRSLATATAPGSTRPLLSDRGPLGIAVGGLLGMLERRCHRYLIGDADGADAWFDAYVAARWSTPACIFHSGERPRRNPLNRETERVPPMAGDRTQHSRKDTAMALYCDAAVMIWDGSSQGTLENVENVVRLCKPCFVYSTVTDRMSIVLEPDGVGRLVRSEGRR